MDLSRLRAENVRLNSVKYAWIDKQREFPHTEVCAILDVSVSGY
jgi:hypothetical protein